MRRVLSLGLVSLALAAVQACSTSSSAPGEADARFDIDSGVEFESGADATMPETSVEAADEPSAADVTVDAIPEASQEAAADALTSDSPADGPPEGAAEEASVEAGPEASAEAGPEGSVDAAPDVRPMCVNPSTDCPTQFTVCKVNYCSAGVCAVQNAPQGTQCTDGGGNICAALGYCESSCLDGMQDATETDVDCGGTYCDAASYTCLAGKRCLVGADCRDKVCTGNVCQAATCSDGVMNGGETGVDCGGPCTALAIPQACPSGDLCNTATDCLSGYCNNYTCTQRSNGDQCWNGSQSCASHFCANSSGGLGLICCDTACTGTCQYCGGGPGLVIGTCGQVQAGNPAPAGQCTSNGTCGNDGNCTAASTCEQRPTTYTCGPTCVGTTYTASGNCDGVGGCGGAQSTCSPYACSTFVPACNTSCSSASDCAPGHNCVGSTCM